MLLSANFWMSLAGLSCLLAAPSLFPYLPILIATRSGSASEFNEALNYVADTLLFAGAALILASALPQRQEARH
jgi:hypothetical protein